MRKTALRIAAFLAAFIVLAFVVFLINQTAQLVALAAGVHPVAGDVVLGLLVALYAFCLIVPIVLFATLPRALVPPAAEDDPAFPAHLERLRRRLQRNRLLRDADVTDRAGVDRALVLLDERADALTRVAGSQVFLTTAISQNGSLDAVVVLGVQSKLILDVARVYWQRPNLRDLLFLYGNVASTAFISSELEDIDLSEQVRPILTTVFGSAAGAVPGLQTASTLIVSSVMAGSANAFLTLRVGAIAKQYCRALVLPERRAVRRSAIAQATRMLGQIASEGAAKVSAAVWRASTRPVRDAFEGMGRYVKETGTTIAGRFRKPGAGPETSGEPPP